MFVDDDNDMWGDLIPQPNFCAHGDGETFSFLQPFPMKRKADDVFEEVKKLKSSSTKKDAEIADLKQQLNALTAKSDREKAELTQQLNDAREAVSVTLEQKRLICECLICACDNLVKDMDFVTPPCGHVMCTGCMGRLLKKECPVCRKKITRKIFLK